MKHVIIILVLFLRACGSDSQLPEEEVIINNHIIMDENSFDEIDSINLSDDLKIIKNDSIEYEAKKEVVKEKLYLEQQKQIDNNSEYEKRQAEINERNIKEEINLKNKINELNENELKIYYIIGRFKDLKADNILKTRREINSDFNKNKFILGTKEQKVYYTRKKIKRIFPERNKSSYELSDFSLLITNSKLFWENHNILIIATKN